MAHNLQWATLGRLLLAACAGIGPVAAQTYKWVDERGVTNYGEKPPAGRPAQRVDTQPSGTIESGNLQQETKESEARRRERAYAPPPPPPGPVSAAPPAPPAPAVHGMRFDTFVYLQRGMSEGELLLRAGPPDYSTVENFQDDIVKSFYYYPTPEDPFLTVVTVRGGRIARIDRTRKIY